MVKNLQLEDLEISTLTRLLALDIVRLERTAKDPVRDAGVRYSASYYADILAGVLVKVNALNVVGDLVEVTEVEPKPAVTVADEYLDSNGVAL